MLHLTIPTIEMWDEKREEFISFKGSELVLEHSLVSISKWESIHHKPFMTDDELTMEETLDYVRCMTITQNVKPIVYELLTNEQLIEIKDYINNPMTATTFSDNGPAGKGPIRKHIITSEVIYANMVLLNIPLTCEKWHLNRLLTLIKTVEIKNQPEKKNTNRAELMRRNAALNAARRKKYNSKG